MRIDGSAGRADAAQKVAKNKKAVVMIEWNGRRAARAGHLRDLLHDCLASPAADQASRLIEAAQLLCSVADMARVEAMVACGAYESAAHVVLGPDRAFLVSRGATGMCLASALIACGCQGAEDHETTAEGATPALAMLAALACALLVEDNQSSVRSPITGLTGLARLH